MSSGMNVIIWLIYNAYYMFIMKLCFFLCTSLREIKHFYIMILVMFPFIIHVQFTYYIVVKNL